MTLVAALSGSNVTILFADTEETVGGYSTRAVDKLEVLDCPGFRVGIAGATSNASYADMLQAEILRSLYALADFNLALIRERLIQTLTDVYSKHIWPRGGDGPQIEYLLAVQPLPSGRPEIIQINETAANVVPSGTTRTIGIGSYLADYLFKRIFPAPIPVSRGESLSFLCAAGMYVADEVRNSISGVGPVDRVAIFGCNGDYDELCPVDIQEIQANFGSLEEYFEYFFIDAMDVDKNYSILEDDHLMKDIRERHKEWYRQWNRRRGDRELLGYFRGQCLYGPPLP